MKKIVNNNLPYTMKNLFNLIKSDSKFASMKYNLTKQQSLVIFVHMNNINERNIL